MGFPKLSLSSSSMVLLLVIMVMVLSFRAESKTYWGDIEVLKELKNGLDSNSVSPGSCISSWDFNVDPCDNLFSNRFTCGFRCDLNVSETSRVTELSLDQAGYNGSLSSISWNLPYLDTLDLSNNFFSGPIPDSLANLTRLRRLGLSMNSFSGEIPTSISSLTELEELYLDNNKLEGAIPASFNNLVSLKRLELQSNKLTSEFPELGSLNNLSFLDASNNAISGEIPWVFPSSLVQISMRNNSLEGTITPESFRTLGYLQVIDMSHNRLSGSVPFLIFDLPSLQQLTLSFNQFSSVQAPASLGTQRAHSYRSEQQRAPRLFTFIHGVNAKALRFVLGEQQVHGYDTDPVRLQSGNTRTRNLTINEAVAWRELLVRTHTGSSNGAPTRFCKREAG